MDWDAAEHLGRQMLKNDAWTKRIFEEFDGAASGLCWFRVSDLGACVCVCARALLSYFTVLGVIHSAACCARRDKEDCRH